jgi:hypothetical protein
VRLLMESLPDFDSEDVNWTLLESPDLAELPASRRRYLEAMYDLAFIRDRTTPAKYEALREIRALPARLNLQAHFRVMLNMEMKMIGHVEGAEVAVREHMGKHDVQTLMPKGVVLTCDATGLSARGHGDRAGYCFRIRSAVPRPNHAESMATRCAARHGIAEPGGSCRSSAQRSVRSSRSAQIRKLFSCFIMRWKPIDNIPKETFLVDIFQPARHTIYSAIYSNITIR